MGERDATTSQFLCGRLTARHVRNTRKHVVAQQTEPADVARLVCKEENNKL